MILIPIKNLSNAKQRLSPVLGAEERLELARALCEDVLGTVAEWQGRPEVAVVTGDPFARALAFRLGFEVIADDFNPGETGAIEMATLVCRDRGAKSTLVIPADIPLVSVSDLQKIHDAGKFAACVLAPDAAGRGTNAAFRSPADLIPLRFGNDSFLPHLAAAKATGLPYTVLELKSMALDIDRPEDLDALVLADGNRRSQELVRGWELGEREQVCSG